MTAQVFFQCFFSEKDPHLNAVKHHLNFCKFFPSFPHFPNSKGQLKME